MINIPTLFTRIIENRPVQPQITKGCEWVLEGKGLLTIKVSGTCVEILKDHDNILRLHRSYKLASGERVTLPCSRNDPDDALLFRAFDNTVNVGTGVYIAYGPGILDNPQGANKPRLVKIAPVDHALIIPTKDSPIRRGFGRTVEDLFTSIRSELAISLIEGLVFQLEEPAMHLKAACQICRRDFGYPWPVKPAQP